MEEEEKEEQIYCILNIRMSRTWLKVCKPLLEASETFIEMFSSQAGRNVELKQESVRVDSPLKIVLCDGENASSASRASNPLSSTFQIATSTCKCSRFLSMQLQMSVKNILCKQERAKADGPEFFYVAIYFSRT